MVSYVSLHLVTNLITLLCADIFIDFKAYRYNYKATPCIRYPRFGICTMYSPAVIQLFVRAWVDEIV